MNRLSLSTFLTITALSVAGLVSHSSAQQGPPATQPPAQGPSATQPPAPPAQQGPCQQIMAACRQAGFVQGGAKAGGCRPARHQVRRVAKISRQVSGGLEERPRSSALY